jgi:hypothetical protein
MVGASRSGAHMTCKGIGHDHLITSGLGFTHDALCLATCHDMSYFVCLINLLNEDMLCSSVF